MKAWVLLLCSACATASPSHDSVEYELACDDNRPAEPTAAASPTWEVLVRFKADKEFHPLRLRAMVAQEGRGVWTVYEDRLEQPGTPLATWEHDYGRDAASGPTDGRWVVEDLVSRISGSQKVLWVGFRGSRLWSSGVDCENAFVRDTDPARLLNPMPIRKAPMLRLDAAP